MKKSIFYTSMLSIIIVLGSLAHGYAMEWTLHTSTSNVEFYYKIQECNGDKTVFLKITNNNDYEVEVNWKEVITDQTFGKDLEGFYGEKQLIIPSGQTLQSDCANPEHLACITLPSEVAPTHKVEIQRFRMKDIKVNASGR